MSLIGNAKERGATDPRLKSVGEVLDGVDGGLPGVVKTISRMIGQNQPSIDCIRQADADFQSASSPEDVWGAALDMAACLRGAMMEPEQPDPPPPPRPEPDPDPVPPRTHNLADVVLAALLTHLHNERAGARR